MPSCSSRILRSFSSAVVAQPVLDGRELRDVKLPIRVELVYHPDKRGLDLILGQVRCLAAGLVFELVIALPDNPAVFVVAVPDLRAVPSAAAAAADLPGEYGGPAVFRIAGSLGENILHQRKLLWRDDGRVAVFHIVLRDGAVIGHGLFCQEIRREGLLKQSTAFVLFVFQDAAHRAFVPFLPASR